MKSVLCVGHAVEDRVYYVDAMPTTASKHQGERLRDRRRRPGGKRRPSQFRVSGGKAMLGARLGDDAAGESIIRDLQSENIDCTLCRRFEGRRSSTSAVFVDRNGERLIVNDLDASMPTAPNWLGDSFPDKIDARSCRHALAGRRMRRTVESKDEGLARHS